MIPVWFIAVPGPNAAKFELAWHDSHASVLGRWFAGFTTTAGEPVKLLPVSWQLAHPLVIPVWFIAVPGPNTVVDLWHVAQSAVVAICPAPCATGVTPKNASPVALAA